MRDDSSIWGADHSLIREFVDSSLWSIRLLHKFQPENTML